MASVQANPRPWFALLGPHSGPYFVGSAVRTIMEVPVCKYYLFLLAVLFFAASPLRAEQPNKPPPNIVLLIGDNWAWPHASIYGDKVVKTPTFDFLAREGVLCLNAFAPFPSCAPSRAALLSGQVSHRLKEAANLWSIFPAQFRVYTDLLRARGYFVGFSGKGWSPGSLAQSQRELNPAGQEFKDFKEFLDAKPDQRPFCFWLGSRFPHAPWDKGQEHKKDMKLEDVTVPPYLPDHPAVRDDILNYYCEVQEFDREAGEALELLRARGLLDNTLIVMTSDNGWQMPRGLANLYDGGTHVPMAIRWGGHLPRGQKLDDFVTLTDLAPTFLEAAGLKPLPEMTGRSFLPLLRGEKQKDRDGVFLERERHANVRKGDLGYPMRGLRTREFLYILNLHPERWPAGDPELHFAVGPYGDVDRSQTKALILENQDADLKKYFQLSFAKRPQEELYDLTKDPGQIHNLASDPAQAEVLASLRDRVTQWMEQTEDPRARGATDFWDKAPYFGPPAKKKALSP
jgi:N-sulfoglucosamine sulfohydrolase